MQHAFSKSFTTIQKKISHKENLHHRKMAVDETWKGDDTLKNELTWIKVETTIIIM